MAKAEKEKVNKSQVIRDAIETGKWEGDNQGLAKYLEETYTGETFPVTLVSTIRSKSKAKGEKVEKPAKAAATPKKGDFFDDVKGNDTPLLEQLRQLKGLIGADGVKKLVDGL